MVQIRQVVAPDSVSVDGLCELLQDAVHGGASVGFLAPLARHTAALYWQRVFDQLPEGLCLWVAEEDGRVVGSAQLDPCTKENGRHRAELQKLFVHGRFRGRGIASQLMRVIEDFAHGDGRTLLVLDTQAGSVAESVYRHLGWVFAGQVPGYAASPNGEFHATAYYYKQIAP